MNDVLSDAVGVWQFLEQTALEVFGTYGFTEIRTPVLEKTELFCRSIGETTDIVEKEMYTFADKSGNSLTLRPEGTAPVMRSLIQHRLTAQDPIAKLCYIGPMFRHERPQKGRYRQFHQIGAEAVGVEDPKIDAQILLMLHHYFTRIGISAISLEINSLGCPACRPDYRTQLISFLQERLDALCSECRRRYLNNPLRVLDCKVETCRVATADAPAMIDHLCDECDGHFKEVRHYLDLLRVPYAVNSRMVRGLDYYVRTTFELVTDQLGSQNAVAAGGRYDGLIESLGGPALPGIGFAIGLERLVLMLDKQQEKAKVPALFIAALGEEAARQAFILMSQLQAQGIWAEMDYMGKSLKAQMRRADKMGAVKTLIIGAEELRTGQAQLKNMADSTQKSVQLDSLVEALS